MRASAILVAFAAAAVSAQVQNYTSSLNMTIDASTVPQQQRAVWCQAQTNTCQELCATNTNQNSCNQADLTYDCTCASNNSAPGLQYYTQTLPTFICQQLFSNCIQANVGSQTGQSACTANIEQLCGTLNPPTAATATGSSSTAANGATGTTAAPTASSTEPASGTVQSSTSHDFASPTLAPVGTGAFAAAAVGLLAYLL